MKVLIPILMGLLVVGCSSTAPAGKFKDYFIGPIKIRFHEEKLPGNRKLDPWTGYGVDGGFPQTVVSSLEITDASGTYSLPADMVNDLGNPNIGHVRVRQNGKLLELSMTNSDGAGGHHVLFQVDLEKARACRFVRVVIEDDFTKTHDWTAIKNRAAAKPVKGLTIKDVAGTYELKVEGGTAQMVFLENGKIEFYENGKKNQEEARLKMAGNEIHFDSEGGDIRVFRIEPNGDLTYIAEIERGERHDHTKERQATFKKIK
jgi:hypothetical protein